MVTDVSTTWAEVIIRVKRKVVVSRMIFIWNFMKATFHQTLMMTSAQVVKTSVTTTDNSPSKDYTHPDDQTTLLHVTPEFKPFTVNNCWYYTNILHFWSFLIFLERSHLCNDFLQLLVCIVFVLFSINYWKCIVTAAFYAHSLGYFECFLGYFC